MENDAQLVTYEQDINLREIIYLLRIKWWIIAICFIVAVIGATIYSYLIANPVYSANALLFVGKEPGEEDDPYSIAQMQVNERLVMDYREIIKSRTAANEVIKRLDLKVKPEYLQRGMNVTTVSNSRMFKISFESTDPEFAADVVNEMSQVIIIKAAEIVDVENVRVVDDAEVPTSPIKPNKKMNIAIAGVIGLMVGIGIIIAAEYFDNTIKNAEDVQKYLGLSILGEIPAFEGERRQGQNGSRKRKAIASLSFRPNGK
jgi:succinoglycan biosynthesis transport protein ExoP